MLKFDCVALSNFNSFNSIIYSVCIVLPKPWTAKNNYTGLFVTGTCSSRYDIDFIDLIYLI